MADLYLCEMDFQEYFAIKGDLSRLEVLFSLPIIYTGNYSPMQRSVLIEILILMKDLMIKSEKLLGKRIDFTDDILIDDKLNIYDVTGLISNFRDAACHSNSHRSKVGNSRFFFGVVQGTTGIRVNELVIGSKYNDDIAYILGKHTLYIKRHLVRAYNEIRINFAHLH